MRNRKATTADFLIAGFLFLLVLAVVVPFINTIAISFSTQREYLNTPLLLIPRKPTLNNYINLLRDKRISIGYLTSLKILLLGPDQLVSDSLTCVRHKPKKLPRQAAYFGSYSVHNAV